MKPYLTAGLSVFLLFFNTLSAPAQSLLRSNSGLAEGYILVNSNLTLAIPGAETTDLDKQQSEAHRLFYKVVADSCPLITQTFAETCEISGVSANVSIGDVRNRGGQVTISGSIQMIVKLKKQETSPAK